MTYSEGMNNEVALTDSQARLIRDVLTREVDRAEVAIAQDISVLTAGGDLRKSRPLHIARLQAHRQQLEGAKSALAAIVAQTNVLSPAI